MPNNKHCIICGCTEDELDGQDVYECLECHLPVCEGCDGLCCELE